MRACCRGGHRHQRRGNGCAAPSCVQATLDVLFLRWSIVPPAASGRPPAIVDGIVISRAPSRVIPRASYAADASRLRTPATGTNCDRPTDRPTDGREPTPDVRTSHGGNGERRATQIYIRRRQCNHDASSQVARREVYCSTNSAPASTTTYIHFRECT